MDQGTIGKQDFKDNNGNNLSAVSEANLYR